MAASECERFRAGLERFLKLAAALPAGEQDRICQAIRLRHDHAKAGEQLNSNNPKTKEVGDHFLHHFAAARDTLKPGEEAVLAELAMSRLASPDQPPKSRGDP